MNEYNWYIDLDGVLAAFSKGYQDLTGINLEGKFLNTPEFWNHIDEAGIDFWANLEWMPDGKELWKYVKKYNPKILSAPSRQESSRIGKQLWVEKHLPGTELILCPAHLKRNYADSDSFLIDDRLETIEQWDQAGGIGIFHISTYNTINILKELDL